MSTVANPPRGIALLALLVAGASAAAPSKATAIHGAVLRLDEPDGKSAAAEHPAVRGAALIAGSQSHKRQEPQVKPKLDPMSSSLFFRHDYPHDQKPPIGPEFDFNHPYPLVQDTDAYDKDYVKDENSDGGEWKAQMEYDVLRTKVFKARADAEVAKRALDKIHKAYDEAKKAEADAAAKVKEAQDAYNKAKARADADADKANSLDAQNGTNASETDGGVGDAVTDVDDKAMTLEDCKKQLEDAQKKLKEAEADKAKRKAEAEAAARAHAKEMAEKHKAAQEAAEKAEAEAKKAAEEAAKAMEAAKKDEKNDADRVKDWEDAKKKMQDAQANEDEIKRKELEARERLHRLRKKQLENHPAISPVEPDDEEGCVCPGSGGSDSSGTSTTSGSGSGSASGSASASASASGSVSDTTTTTTHWWPFGETTAAPAGGENHEAPKGCPPCPVTKEGKPCDTNAVGEEGNNAAAEKPGEQEQKPGGSGSWGMPWDSAKVSTSPAMLTALVVAVAATF